MSDIEFTKEQRLLIEQIKQSSGLSEEEIIKMISSKEVESEQVESEDNSEPFTEEEMKQKMADLEKPLTEEEIIEVKQNELEKIMQWPRNLGRRQLADYLNGKQLSARNSILAHCYSCMGGYESSTQKDCMVYSCALYDFQPYRSAGKIKRRGISKIEEDEDESESTETEPTTE